MLARLWPRFALEACFLVAVALAAGLLDLSWQEIVGVMAAAYLLTVAVELGTWRLRRPAPAQATPLAAGTTVQALEAEPLLSEPVTSSVRVLDEPPPRPEEDEERLEEIAPAEEPEPPQAEAEPEAKPEPEPEPEAGEAEPEPVMEEPEPEAEEAEPELEPEPEPDEPEPEPEPVRLAPVPDPEPEPVPAREPEPEPQPAAVATLPPPAAPQEWNLWELERLVREAAADDPAREQELGYLVVYLREFASPDGLLPAEFDDLVRDSFGDLLAARRR